MKMVISVTASEKVCPIQYQSLERTVFVSMEVESETVDIESVTHDLQMRAEAAMYGSLARGVEEYQKPGKFYRDAAMKRVMALGNPKAFDQE